jgi:hypothetical protein
MTSGIFLVDGDRLEELREEEYETEEWFQRLLARHTAIISGELINPDKPRQWLFISREMGVLDQEGGNARWSLDHLLIDQDGIPTLVEVKRSSDTRSRREVVAQMLDYAANARNWPIEQIRASFETSCETDGRDATAVLQEHLGPLLEPDDFWQAVRVNVASGRLRLLFVADEIPIELQRIIEFLNEQMPKTEVLGVEIKQYRRQVPGETARTMVPRVIGLTAAARDTKSGGSRATRHWDEESFVETLKERGRSDLIAPVRALIDWSERVAGRITWGTGLVNGSFSPTFLVGRAQVKPFHVWSDPGAWIYLEGLSHRPPFSEQPDKLEEYLSRVRAAGISLTEEPSDGWLRLDLDRLKEPTIMAKFVEILDWFAQTVRSTNSN